MSRHDPKFTRRELAKAGFAASAGLVLAGAFPARRAAAEDLPLVTDVPALAPIVSSLQYVHESAKEGQNCSNCVLYTAKKDGKGACQVMQGGWVKEGGWCASWAPKPS